jgi:DMSO/TMAO reductase YedYZ molybdopterin-dependent catalytic subunit
MGSTGNKNLNITEREVRYAMSKTSSNLAAASFLHISVPTWKKYANRIIDPETGKTLYELHKTTTRQRPTSEYKLKQKNQTYLQFLDLLEGKATPTKGSRLKEKLIN